MSTVHRTEGRHVQPRSRRRRRRSRLPQILLGLALIFAVGYFLIGSFAKDDSPSDQGKENESVETGGPVSGTEQGEGKDLAAEEPIQPQEPVTPEEPTPPQEPVIPEEPVDQEFLLLVNPWTLMPEDYEVTLTQLSNGQSVDERCYPDLQDMMDACRAEGLQPLICSSFRTWEKQERLYNNKIQRLINGGMDPEIAPEEAGKVVAVPGTSEHQLGLAVDIVDVNHQVLDETQEDTAVQQWLMEHSWEYGFILRYPNEKSEVTGIIYEPWHYRYVGKAAAKEIYEQGVCLEEYLQESAV